MAIAFSNLGTSANPDINSNADATSYANSSWTPPSSGLIIVFVYNRKNAGPETPTISGNSLTWTNIVSTTTADTNHRLTLFGANASGSSTGATTVDFGGVTQLGCLASFFLAEGVDLSGGVAAAFVQEPTNTAASGTSLSVTLAAAASTDNRPISGFFHFAQEATNPRTNWTEADDMNTTGPNVGVQTQYRTDAIETTASASWATDGPSIGIAAELAVSGGGGGTDSVDPFGTSGFFGG